MRTIGAYTSWAGPPPPDPVQGEFVWERMMVTLMRNAWSKRAESIQLGTCSALLVVCLGVSGCGRQAATVVDSGVDSQSAIAVHSTDASADPMTMRVDAQCPVAGYPFASLLTGFKDWTTAVGKMVSPARPEASAVARDSDGNPFMVYGEFDAVIDKSLAGPQLESQIPLSFQGGKSDGVVTDVDVHAQSAWAHDGSFLGLVRADAQAPTGWIADVLPVVDGRVVFPNVGCFEPAGLTDVDERSVSVLVFDNGAVTESSGLFQTASLDEIARSVAQ